MIDGRPTVAEGHEIADEVERRGLMEAGGFAAVVVHVEPPEDD